MNGNGSQPTPLEDLDDVDLAGLLELALREAREELAAKVARVDVLAALHERALAVAATAPDDLSPVTHERLREHALAAGGEEELARLEALLDRL